MNDLELREKGPPEDFDNTILSNWTSCSRRLYWFLRGLDYRNIPPYFTFGRCFGTSANIWHSREGLPLKERLGEAILAAQEIWEAEAPIEDNLNSWENFLSLFKQYCGNYGAKEQWKMVYGEGEKGFRLPLPGAPLGVNYCGAIDSPILWKPYGMLVREDKTTGAWINQGFLDQWDMATQVTGYIWAFEQTVGECFGALMNIGGKKERFDGKGKDRKPAPELRFARYLTKRTKEELERFEVETVRLIEDIWREWDKGEWNWDKIGKRNPMECAGGMGRKKCLFYSLCALDVEPWELEEHNLLDEFSWRGRWAPWERDGSDE